SRVDHAAQKSLTTWTLAFSCAVHSAGSARSGSAAAPNAAVPRNSRRVTSFFSSSMSGSLVWKSLLSQHRERHATRSTEHHAGTRRPSRCPVKVLGYAEIQCHAVGSPESKPAATTHRDR